MNADLEGEAVLFTPYYRGLKAKAIEYRKVKRAVIETFKESGYGEWIQPLAKVDMFQIRNLV